MENISLSRIDDYEFDAGFPLLGASKDEVVIEEHKIELNTKHDPQDILADMDNFTSLKNSISDDGNSFSEVDFKYLLAKSPSDEPKKPNKSKKETEEEERERMQVLVSNFTEDQLDRYEMFRRAAFPKASIKRIMQVITGNTVSQNVVIAMSGIAKVFVGEVVEEALDIMEAQNDNAPLQPKHLREAARRLRLKGKIPGLRDKKPNYRF